METFNGVIEKLASHLINEDVIGIYDNSVCNRIISVITGDFGENSKSVEEYLINGIFKDYEEDIHYLKHIIEENHHEMLLAILLSLVPFTEKDSVLRSFEQATKKLTVTEREILVKSLPRLYDSQECYKPHLNYIYDFVRGETPWVNNSFCEELRSEGQSMAKFVSDTTTTMQKRENLAKYLLLVEESKTDVKILENSLKSIKCEISSSDSHNELMRKEYNYAKLTLESDIKFDCEMAEMIEALKKKGSQIDELIRKYSNSVNRTNENICKHEENCEILDEKIVQIGQSGRNAYFPVTKSTSWTKMPPMLPKSMSWTSNLASFDEVLPKTERKKGLLKKMFTFNSKK